MDTSTHAVIGLGLAGLSHIDPAVMTHPATASAVFFGVLLGSQAPDADVALKLKDNTTYIRQHRGISHSIPMLPIWALLIAGLMTLLNKGALFWHVLLWTALAVAIHVITDLCNAYGTQAAWPVTDKWLSFDFIALFDPIIFSSHLVAVALWGLGVLSPRIVFPVLYALLLVYFLWRASVHKKLKDQMLLFDEEYVHSDTYTLIPTVSLSRWNVVKPLPEGAYRIGNWNHNRLHWTETAYCDKHPAVEASKEHPAVEALLYISRYACATVEPTGYGYAVRWADVRYRHRKQFPLVAVVMMNAKYETLDYFVGWLSKTHSGKHFGLEYE